MNLPWLEQRRETPELLEGSLQILGTPKSGLSGFITND
jgi:hypothetical protein